MKAKVIFVHNKFKWNKTGTWLSPFIRTALSLDNFNTGDAPVYFNHVAILLGEQVIEAGWNKEKKRGEVISTHIVEWLEGREHGTYKYIDAELKHDPRLALGVPYALFEVIVLQPLRLLFRKKFWFGSKTPSKFYCSSLTAYCLGIPNFYEIDPEDLLNILCHKK